MCVARVKLRAGIWKNVSADAQHLLTKLLEPDPRERITVTDALQHPWLRVRLASLLSFLLAAPRRAAPSNNVCTSYPSRSRTSYSYSYPYLE